MVIFRGTVSNKDNGWKPTIPAGINRPSPSETISHVIRVPDHQTRLAGLNDSCRFRTRDPVRKVYFYTMGEVGRGISSAAEGEESPLGGQLE